MLQGSHAVRRMSPAFLTIAMLGVVGLLVVMYIGKKLLAREAPAPADTRLTVPMALSELEPGTRVTEAHLAMGPIDRSKVTRDTVLTSRVLVGRVVKNKINAAEPIKSLDLYPPGKNAPLEISPDMVAVSVSAPAPFVAEKGQYVNVHFIPSSAPDDEKTGGRILTLFQGVKVLELGAVGGGRSELNVTLELTREQANIILLARDKGALDFTFAPGGKGTGVVAVSDQDRATLYEILGYSPEPPEEPAPPFTTEIFSGPGRGVNTFRNGRLDENSGRNNSGQGDGGGIGRPAPNLRGAQRNQPGAPAPSSAMVTTPEVR